MYDKISSNISWKMITRDIVLVSCLRFLFRFQSSSLGHETESCKMVDWVCSVFQTSPSYYKTGAMLVNLNIFQLKNNYNIFLFLPHFEGQGLPVLDLECRDEPSTDMLGVAASLGVTSLLLPSDLRVSDCLCIDEARRSL